MEKTLKVIGAIIVIGVVIGFLFSLLAFAFTGDIKDGIWAVLFALALRVETSVEVDGGKRK